MKKLISLTLALILACSVGALAETFAFDEAGFQIQVPDENWISFTGELFSLFSGMELPYEEEIDGVTVSIDVRLMTMNMLDGSILIDMVSVPDEAYLAGVFDELRNRLLEGAMDEIIGFSNEEMELTDAQWEETAFLNDPAVLIRLEAKHQTEGTYCMNVLLVKSISSIEVIFMVSPDPEMPAQMLSWFAPIDDAKPAATPAAPSSKSNAA